MAGKRLFMSKLFTTKKAITGLLLISAGICIGYVIGLVAANYQHNNEYAYNSLYTIDRAMDGLLQQANNGFPNKDARISLEKIALTQIIIVATLKPNLNYLKGTASEALCKAIYYDEIYKLGVDVDKELSELASTYLLSIKFDVIENIKSGISISECPLVEK